jgi:hypothetical protein
MNKKPWAKCVNRHISPDSGLPRLTEEELARWERLGLLVPLERQYRYTDLELTLGLLMLQRVVIAEVKAGDE